MMPPVVEKPLFLLDYDGTLAEITDDPAQATPYPGVVDTLRELADRYPLRLVSGRRVEDLASLVPAPQLLALGVHGMEEGPLAGPVGTRISEEDAALMDEVRSRLPAISGVRPEDKGAAVALHYRGVSDEERVLAELHEWATSLPASLETVWGKKVVEVRPRGYDKGRAAMELAAEYPQATPVMIGDDTTDEDAFRALSRSLPEAVTIKVGEGESVARYRLEDIPAVVEYLAAYLHD